jgi:hypothetical protein
MEKDLERSNPSQMIKEGGKELKKVSYGLILKNGKATGKIKSQPND